MDSNDPSAGVASTRCVAKRPYACFQCGRTFTRKAALIQHEHPPIGCSGDKHRSADRKATTRRKRERRRPRAGGPAADLIRCETCGKVMTTRYTLTEHMMTHRGERPHACTQCDKKYACRSSLRKHVRTKHPGLSLPPISRRAAAPPTGNHDQPMAGQTPPADLDEPMAGQTPSADLDVSMAGQAPPVIYDGPVAGKAPLVDYYEPMVKQTPPADLDVPMAGQTPSADLDVPMAGQAPPVIYVGPVAGQALVAGQAPLVDYYEPMVGQTAPADLDVPAAGQAPSAGNDWLLAEQEPPAEYDWLLAGQALLADFDWLTTGQAPPTEYDLLAARQAPPAEYDWLAAEQVPPVDYGAPMTRQMPSVGYDGLVAAQAQPMDYGGLVAGQAPLAGYDWPVAGQAPPARYDWPVAGLAPLVDYDAPVTGQTPSVDYVGLMAGQALPVYNDAPVAGQTRSEVHGGLVAGQAHSVGYDWPVAGQAPPVGYYGSAASVLTEDESVMSALVHDQQLIGARTSKNPVLLVPEDGTRDAGQEFTAVVPHMSGAKLVSDHDSGVGGRSAEEPVGERTEWPRLFGSVDDLTLSYMELELCINYLSQLMSMERVLNCYYGCAVECDNDDPKPSLPVLQGPTPPPPTPPLPTPGCSRQPDVVPAVGPVSGKMGPYPCDVCGKVLKFSDHLKSHMLLHTKPSRPQRVRPKVKTNCPLCLRVLDKNSMSRHMARLHSVTRTSRNAQHTATATAERDDPRSVGSATAPEQPGPSTMSDTSPPTAAEAARSPSVTQCLKETTQRQL